MGERTEKTTYVQFTDIKKALDVFGECTGDYYIWYDFRTNELVFSKNIQDSDDLSIYNKRSCTLEEWRQGVDPRDVDLLEQTMTELQEGSRESYSLNYRVKNKKGKTIWVNSNGKVYSSDEGVPVYVLGRISKNEPAKKIKNYSNRELKEEISRILQSVRPGYLLLIGVDNMKIINLKYGRDRGDILLRDIEHTVRKETGKKYQVYRINGDWFAVNLIGYNAEEVEAVFQKVQKCLSGQCTLSGGAVSYTDYYVSDENIFLQYAETSLEYSKSHGKNSLSFFSPDDYEEKLQTLELREELNASVENGFKGFSLVYQPQVGVGAYKVCGAEVLLRYRSDKNGEVPAAKVVSILEQTELICPVGLWVLREALAAYKRWDGKFPDFHISVNMSYSQLRKDSIEDDVLDILKESGVPGSALIIEVTESMELTDYPHLNDIFGKWRKAGIQISVDDFGTGYSSLGRLKEMEVDEIKIDQCFVRDIQKSLYNYRLLSNIIELADSCQIRVCCEGVETEEELMVLEELKPALLQGYLFSRPCSEKAFGRLLMQNIQVFRHKEDQGDLLAKLADQQEFDMISENEATKIILNADNDIIYLSDLDTYEIYYLNPAGQKTFGVKDYRGRKCYKVLHGFDEPCRFCTNQILSQNKFHVWENENTYCGRRFILKDKLVSYGGKKMRMEVALDITKNEYISQTAKERLEFADKIVEYVNTLSEVADYDKAFNQVLASVGEFYKADRAYFFEPSPNREDFWRNTHEWCAAGVSEEKHNLQNISPQELKRWLDLFAKKESVIILNLDLYQQSSPLEWEVLSAQGIKRLIAVPLNDGDRIIGFIGVDNPRYCICDDSQIRVLASFLTMWIRQKQKK